MSTKDLTAKAKTLKGLMMMKQELEAEIKSLQDEIKDEMTARDTDEIIAGDYKLRYAVVVTNRFDTSAFKRTHADLYGQYTKETTSKRFSIA